ncbi:MAG: AMP-binding protein [Acidimicrobiales bacterium]
MPAPLFVRSETEPDAAAIVSPRGTHTWAGLEAAAARVANGLRSLGLAEGDRVGVLARNRPEWVETQLGSLRAGTRLVPINWHLTAAEVAFILADSGTRVLITDPEDEEVATRAAEEAGVKTVLVAEGSYDEWVSAQSDVAPESSVGGGVVLYSSGTTGRPKGILRSDQGLGLERTLEGYRRTGDFYRYENGGAHLVACPLYHAAPPAHVMFALTHAQSVVLMERFDAAEALELVGRHRITSTHMVPTQFIRLLRLPEDLRRVAEVSSLTTVCHGAAPCPEWVKRAMIDWLGPVIIEYFGSSEGTGPLIADSHEWLAHPGTVGRPGPTLAVSVVDEDGKDLPPGEVGTLYFQRSDGAPEYLGDKAKTLAGRLPDGRFTVGDVGWLDDEGYVYLADRGVDLIISAGVNIYPAEVEAVLSEHPAVQDCAVFGVPDDEWGEAVKAAVTLSPGQTATAAELMEWCREHLAGFKCPRSVDFHDALPREESGKLKKRFLRDPHWEGRVRPAAQPVARSAASSGGHVALDPQ